MRMDRDAFWFRLAADYAERATCPRAKIGCILVKFDRMIGAGFNGAPERAAHCPSEGDALREHLLIDHCQISRHAEENALRNALLPPFGATLYVVGPRPVCLNCAKKLREMGVHDVRWQASVPSLDRVLAEVVSWQRETFFPPTIDDVPATVEHIRREVEELVADPYDTSEMADVLILLARLADNLSADLPSVVAGKLAVLRARTWQPADEHGVTEHVREVPA